MIFNKPYEKTKEKGWDKTSPLIMELYFLDDGSLIINKVRSITLIPPDQFEVVRTIGCHYLSHLSGKEAYDFLVEQNHSLDKNGLSSCKVSVATGVGKTE